MVDELREHSLDETDDELQITSDRRRFGEGSYEDWYAKDRTPFGLIDDATGMLACVVMIGPKALGVRPGQESSGAERQVDESKVGAGEWHTIAYRSYRPFRGKGLMPGFIEFVSGVYVANRPGARLWAGIDANNLPSLGLVRKLGYTIIKGADDEGWVTAVR
jgi:hypothetical protein